MTHQEIEHFNSAQRAKSVFELLENGQASALLPIIFAVVISK